MALRLSKQQILSSKKDIDRLFSKGRSINLSPVRLIYTPANNSGLGNRILFSVPSRIFKRAVDRNLIKRRMREAFRIHQEKLQVPINLNLAYIYITKKVLPFSEIEKKIMLSFQKLKNEFEA